MQLSLALALILYASAASKADDGPAAPDDALFRTGDEERFEVAVKGVTGAHIDICADIVTGRHCRIHTATTEGVPVLVDILVHDGKRGRKLVELRLVENLAKTPARVLAVSDLLAPGESDVTGPGWNSLFEISLTQKQPPTE